MVGSWRGGWGGGGARLGKVVARERGGWGGGVPAGSPATTHILRKEDRNLLSRLSR